MTFNRVSPTCLCLCLAAVVNTADAQNQASPASAAYVSDASGVASAGDFSGSYLFGNDGGTYFLFDKLVGDGPGFDNGYSRLGLRVKLYDAGSSHLWGSGYALITDDTRVGFNVGGGYRWLYDSNIISVHGWWDSYETNSGNRYNQVTAGFELLHEEVDFRVNGYMPINETENFIGVTDPGSTSVFTSRGIGFLGRGIDEQALKGIDTEVGTAIFGVNWARVYAGGYWYDGADTSYGGVRGRVETAISPDLSLNFMVQNDTVNNTNYNLGVEYRFSGGLSPGFFTPFHGESRKYNPVRRQWPVATQLVDVATTVPMLNPKTGGIMTAAFVDNRNASAGDGSFENPFSELPSSVAADKIFVFAGGVGSETTGNITLRPEQQLLGEGKLYTFDDPIRGTVTVPAAFRSTGDRPLLTAADPSRSVITLSDWNRVANFDIEGPAVAAISGSNIDGFQIDMVTAIGVTDGVRINNASGQGLIRNSGFDVADQGVFISNTTGPELNLMLNSVATNGGREGIHVAADGADVNLIANTLRANNATDAGIILDASLNGNMTADVDDAYVGNTGGVTGNGFVLNVDSGAEMAVELTRLGAAGNDDLFVVNVQNGQLNGVVGGGTTTSGGVLLTPGATFSTSVTGSGVKLNLDDATGRLSFATLRANGNAVNGVEIDASGDGTNFMVDVVSSQLDANLASGMHTDVFDGADLRYFVDPTFVRLSGGSGFEYDVRGAGSVFIADLIQTTFKDSTLHGISGRVFNGAAANVDVVDSSALNAGLNGYNLLVDRNADFVGTVTDGDFSLAGDAAFDITVRNGSNAQLVMNDVTGRDNGNVGLQYLVEDGIHGPSELLLGVTIGDFNRNPDSNVVGTVRGDNSRASVYFNTVGAEAFANNGAVVLTAEDGGILNQHWNIGSISQSAATGITARVDGAGSQMRLNLNQVNVGTNFGDGIDASLTNGGPDSLLNISLVNSNVSLNQGSGVILEIDGPGASSNVIFDNTPVNQNFGGDGFRFDVTGGAGLLVNAFGPSTNFLSNGGQAWDGSVSGAGSIANVTFNGTSALGNLQEGGVFDVAAGGQLNLNLANLQISQHPLDGLVITVDGPGSSATINADQVMMTRNGLSLVGDAFDARATNGGQITANLFNMIITENREDALRFDASTGGIIDALLMDVDTGLNGRHGLEYHASSGGQVTIGARSSDFSDNGTAFTADGVFGTATGAGSSASGLFLGVTANNNGGSGFNFDVSGGATLLADIRSDASTFGDSSASGNDANGVRFNAEDAGTMGFLKMMGANTFDDNGADGVNFDAVGVNMAVAQVTGTVNNNAADGINIRMIDVDTGAISLVGAGLATISGNGDDGIDITTQNVDLITKTVNGMQIPDFQIDGFVFSGNGGDPIVINMVDTTFEDGEITDNIIDGGLDGINVHLGAGDGDLLIDNNVISGAQRYGIAVTSDAGTHKVTITNNNVTTSGDTNIFVDLFGTTETGLMINDNILVGGGSPVPILNTGLNFTGTLASTSPSPGFTPPDTMGGVGRDHIVQILNNGYAVFDKTTGNQLFSSTLEDFWIAAGLPPIGATEILADPRIIFDPTVNRWFVVTIDADPGAIGSASNNILVAVSQTEDPLDGFIGLEFVADTIDANRLADYPTLGIDADGIYIGTNNFNPGFSDVAIYSIPKADLLAAVPTLANLTRFEASDPTIYGDTLQPAVDFGPSDGVTNLLATEGFGGGSNLVRADIFGAAGPGAVLSGPVDVPVTPYLPGPPGDQPLAGALLDNVSPRISGNVVKVGGSLWATHAVLGTNGNSIVRWYEIDATTNAVIQTGDIVNAALDFLDPSIAVNAQGTVVIGFTGTGATQSASAMSVLGTTDNMGTTTFQAPTINQMGTGSYLAGGNPSRWGDYSSTVVDPDDPNTFWTFQEFANGFGDFGVQITQLTFQPAVAGGTVNDGIHVNVRENATLTDSMINNNIADDHGGDGIEVIVTDAADVQDLMINGNSTSGNGGDGIRFEKNSTGALESITVSNNMSTDNFEDGLEVLLSPGPGAPEIMVNGNMVMDNTNGGIIVSAVDTAVGDVSVSQNTVRNNLAGDGILLDLGNTTGGPLAAGNIILTGNISTDSANNGVFVNVMDRVGVDTLTVSNSNISTNMAGGLVLQVEDTAIMDLLLDSNVTSDNVGGDGVLLDLLNSPIDTLTITNSGSSANTGDGVNLNLDGAPVGTLNISNNNTGGTSSSIGLNFVIGGNTFTDPFMITNASSGVNDITGFMLDVSTAIPNAAGAVLFDTEATGAPVPFQPLVNSDVFTDLQTVNGVAITPGTNPLQDSMGVILPGGGIPDDTQLIDLAFGDFNPMETFTWEIDLDFATLPNSTVFGSDLVGSTIRVDFTGGQFLTGNLQPIPGNPLGSTFVATGGTLTGTPGFSGNAGDGLRISTSNGSDIGALLLDDNVVDGNMSHGIELLIDDSTLPPVGGTSSVSRNMIVNNGGDGFRLINPDTNGNDFEIDFVDNTVDGNTGVGINVELNGDSGGMTTQLTGNAVSNNGSIGASFVVQDDATLDLTIGDSTQDQNVFANNVDAGIAVKTKDMSTASIIVENTQVTGTVDGPNAAFDGDGLAVHSSGSSIVTSMTVGDDTLENTEFSNNAGNGISVEISDNARNPNLTIQNVLANNNGVHGIGLRRTGFSTFSEDLDSDGVLDPGEDVNGDGMLGNAMITMTTANGNGGNGLDVFVTGAQLPVQQVDVMLNQNSFNNNTVGMNFTVNNDAILLVNAANNVVNGNSSHGISVVTNQNAAFGNVLPSVGNPFSPLAIPSTFSSNIVTNNGGNGFNFVANNNSIQVIDVDDAGAANPVSPLNPGGTSATIIDGNGGNQVQITGNNNSRQNIDLVGVRITNVNGATTGDGVNIDANGTSTVDVEIAGGINGPAILGAAIAHVSVPGLGGTGGALADGIDAVVEDQSILRLDVQDVSLFNNTGDAISLMNIGPNNTGNQAGGSGNRQTIQANFDNVDARLSGDRGLDVLLTGNVGGRTINQGDTDMPVFINVANSTFSSNTNEGIFFRAQPGFTHGGDNLYTDLVAEFNVLDSLIQSNGSDSIVDGLVMEIGTNAYVLSEISGNMFGANGLDDFHTNAFDSGGNPNTAQLDLAFQDNSGDHIRPTAFGTTTGSALFILDNALTVEPNNDFGTFGMPQMEVFGPDGFFTNGYILRPMSNHGDPTFP